MFLQLFVLFIIIIERLNKYSLRKFETHFINFKLVGSTFNIEGQ